MADFIASPLAVLFNKSLVSGDLPAGFKEGIISPIFKTGKTDPSVPENYRGITLTHILSKLLESVVHIQVSEFLRSRSALRDFEYGFRKGYSC